MERWGISDDEDDRGGLATKVKAPPRRQIHLLQRKTSSLGKGLGKTSGWVHRTTLKDSGVEMVPGVTYDKIDDDGLHITVDDEPRVLDVDTIVLCTGRSPCATSSSRSRRPASVHVIGGADVAVELDAKRAIKQATELAAASEPYRAMARRRLVRRERAHDMSATSGPRPRAVAAAADSVHGADDRARSTALVGHPAAAASSRRSSRGSTAPCSTDGDEGTTASHPCEAQRSCRRPASQLLVGRRSPEGVRESGPSRRMSWHREWSPPRRVEPLT